ncbi:secreted protein [gut metagenome]|uniref:Secreted protein n=1 Tax=gut metagenome TaxID=749906 RepID=J9BUA9_9ZZZZ
MKKIYGFIAALLMCFVTTAQAQVAWTPAENSVEEADFETGEGHFYVLQEGDNTKLNDAGEEVTDGHSQGKYMSSGEGAQSVEVTPECIFCFIPTGEEAQGFPVYVLYNLAKQQYLAMDGAYVPTKAQAYKFTARKAEAKDEESLSATDWLEYSNAVSSTRSIHAVENGAWVLCHPSQKQYIGFVGAISFRPWVDTNNWYIKVATKSEMSGFEQLSEAFTKYFGQNGEEPTLEHFPVGTTTGCISQEIFDQLVAAYNEANALMAIGDAAGDEECLAAVKSIEDAFAAYQKGLVGLTEGYYMVKNKRGGFLKTKDNKAFVDKGISYPVESWTLAKTTYIWKVEKSETDGQFLFKNYANNLYLGAGGQFNMAEKGVAFRPEHHDSIDYIIFEGSNQINAKMDGFLCHWNDKSDVGNHFRFYAVDAAAIDSLDQKVEQQMIDKKLAEIVQGASNDMKRVAYKNGFIKDGFYSLPSDSGLVRKFAKCNATEPSEGKEIYAFDGKLDTYYHTIWSDKSKFPNDLHWVQLDLGKEVSSVVVKFSYRHNNNNSNPSRIALVAPEDGNPEAEVWGDTLYKDTVVYEYATQYPAGKRDSTTYICKIDLGKSVQYLRMAVPTTKVNQIKGGGPLWHVAEFRIYDAAECVENPKYTMVPADVKKALEDAIAEGEAAVAAHKGTEELCEKVEKALDAFWEAYPDPNDLIYSIEVAEEKIATAVEGDLMAQYEAGAKDALQAVVDAIKTAIDGKDLTLAEIKEYQAKLDAAVAEFNSKLHVPETGEVYRIVCVAPTEFDGDPHRQWGSYVASANADVNGHPVWKYNPDFDEIIDDRLNALWLVTKDEKGFVFKNLANGYYLNNPYEGLDEEDYDEVEGTKLGFSVEPKHFNLEASTIAEGAFLVSVINGQYMNADPVGSVVHYFDRTDIHAIFTFEKLEDELTGNIVDVKPGKVQVVTLPYEVQSVVTAANDFTGVAYKVLGKKDNQIVLDAYAEGETIEAGVPFIIEALAADPTIEGDKGETYIQADLANTDILNQTYVYDVKQVNGLVSAPAEIKVGAGYGMIVDKTVVPTSDKDVIAAGTGFFNNSLPDATEEGTYFLAVEGTITGEGTAVENVTIQKNVASDVYTISGVKVRSNVKAANATKGLPKGVYIVAGKKVVVK